jgi:hypothetical protein
MNSMELILAVSSLMGAVAMGAVIADWRSRIAERAARDSQSKMISDINTVHNTLAMKLAEHEDSISGLNSFIKGYKK